MKKNTNNFYASFSDISHAHFQVDLYRKTINKAFIQVANKFLTTSSEIDTNALAQAMYRALFFNEERNLRTLLSQIHSHLREPYTLENFLSNYFYIILNHYVKSFYGRRLGWKRIARFTTAIENFIDWSQTIDYRIEDERSLLSPEEQAISNLESIREKKVRISVLNTYQGVPIQYKASVVHTTADSIFLKVHPIQEAAAKDQHAIYILGISPLEYDLFAQVKAVRYKGHVLLELKNFNVLKESLYQRQSVRVQPQRNTLLHLLYDKLSYKVQLFDISLGGLAIITTKKITIPSFASLKIKVPDTLFGKEVTINATLIQSSHFESSEKYHFKLNLTRSQETLLSRYITKRENEIIQNLKQWV
ncbi:MAG: PilZ domain-containing protein [Campylobacterota bacterium]|nr:PilZ domain-containing protein [Campylobacterota bacterium]